jgi:Zn-finger nucleic acid-binding protein
VSQHPTRKCPVSGEPMQQVDLHGVTVDRSPHGVWLDQGELFQITEAERKQVGEMEKFFTGVKAFFKIQARPEDRGQHQQDRDLPCPVCGDDLDIDTYRHVYIDRCRQSHGIWLDNGELEQILTRLKEDPDFLSGMRLRLSDMKI